jgi:hypothetical protein
VSAALDPDNGWLRDVGLLGQLVRRPAERHAPPDDLSHLWGQSRARLVRNRCINLMTER